jgi:hypothetical protein
VRIDDTLYEVDLSLRALEVQLRFDPYRMSRIEVYYRGQSIGLRLSHQRHRFPGDCWFFPRSVRLIVGPVILYYN